jgi:hypothetical protein
MTPKRVILFCTLIGSTLGGCVPALWGAGGFSMSGVIFSAVGGAIGIWVGFKLAGRL